MNNEIEELIEKANKIMSRTGNKHGTKYPKSLKRIVTLLRNEHKMSIKEVVAVVPISSYSAREWPRQSLERQHFNKVTVKEPLPQKVPRKKVVNNNDQLDSIIFNLKFLLVLITLLLFESLAFHLID